MDDTSSSAFGPILAGAKAGAETGRPARAGLCILPVVPDWAPRSFFARPCCSLHKAACQKGNRMNTIRSILSALSVLWVLLTASGEEAAVWQRDAQERNGKGA